MASLSPEDDTTGTSSSVFMAVTISQKVDISQEKYTLVAEMSHIHIH
jgi:hypothetical protein